MQLITDVIPPVELTGYGRDEVDVFDRENSTLSNIFPNEDTQSLTVSWSINGRDDETASYRAFDAESKIGGAGRSRRATAELVPLSYKERFGEYDRVLRRAAGSPEDVAAAADRINERVSRAIVNRLVLARGEVLATGSLDINEDKFVQTADFGRREDFTATAGTLWDADGDVMEDLEAWMGLYEDENGFLPDVAYISRRIAAALQRSETVRGYFGDNAPRLVTLQDINALITAQGLPLLQVFNARVNRQDVLPADTVVFASTGQIGATVWGPTAESDDPRYGLAYGDQPGLVVGMYETEDPKVTWIRSNATAMPILTDANATFAAKVLA